MPHERSSGGPDTAGALGSGRRAVVLLLYALSGAAGLVYEVAWGRRLSLVLGATAVSGAVVLAAFLGALGIGARLGGRVADRTRSPLRAYGLLEILAAAWALLVPFVAPALEAVYVTAASRLAGAARIPLAFVTALAVVGPAAILLGATFPLVLKALAGEARRVGRTASAALRGQHRRRRRGGALGRLLGDRRVRGRCDGPGGGARRGERRRRRDPRRARDRRPGGRLARWRTTAGLAAPRAALARRGALGPRRPGRRGGGLPHPRLLHRGLHRLFRGDARRLSRRTRGRQPAARSARSRAGSGRARRSACCSSRRGSPCSWWARRSPPSRASCAAFATRRRRARTHRWRSRAPRSSARRSSSSHRRSCSARPIPSACGGRPATTSGVSAGGSARWRCGTPWVPSPGRSSSC